MPRKQLIIAILIYSVLMFGGYLFFRWGAENFGLWTLVFTIPPMVAIGFWIDHRDKRNS